MSEERDPPTPAGRARRNYTALQFVLLAGALAVVLSALLAAGLAFGLAIASAACLAVVAFAIWFIAANLVGMERRSGGDRRPGR
jgi:hypothetical protein